MGESSDRKPTLQDGLIGLLESGCIPWRPRWRVRAVGERHLNLFSGTAYGGADPLLLEVATVQRRTPLPWWCTYAEAKAAGLSPRRGAGGIRLGLASSRANHRQRVRVVFNVADLVGPTLQRALAQRRRALRASRATEQQRLLAAENQLRHWPVRIREGRHLPGYRIAADQIFLPCRHTFHCREAFLARWAREQIRSTWHPGRLRWEGEERNRCTVAPKEFVIELTWILLADRLGLGVEDGPFVLTEADWIQMLQPSPDRFLELLTTAGKLMELLAPATAPVRGSADKLLALV